MTSELRAVGYSYRANARNKPDETDAVASDMKHWSRSGSITRAIQQALGVPTALKTEGAMNESEEEQESICAAYSTITAQYDETWKKKASWSKNAKA